MPDFTLRAIRRRSFMSDEAVAAFRAEQGQRLRTIVALHADEPKPRWRLLQKLASASG